MMFIRFLTTIVDHLIAIIKYDCFICNISLYICRGFKILSIFFLLHSENFTTKMMWQKKGNDATLSIQNLLIQYVLVWFISLFSLFVALNL